MDDTAPSSPPAQTRLWHPFADMAVVKDSEQVFTRAQDVWLWDESGRRYLDATASLWYANVGHGRQEIVDAIAAQLSELDAYSIFGDSTNAPARNLAQRLSELAPIEDARVFLTTGGGDAADTAAKLARQYWSVVGAPSRMHLIGRSGGYHGTNGFGTSVGGIEANRAGFGVLIPHASTVPFDSVEALDQEIRRVGPDNVAAFFMEPIIGAGGVQIPPEGYVEGAAEVCADYGVLFIVDSVICGFGRLGSWFGIERWDVSPDMITFAKGVSSGYMPLGGVVTSWRVAEPFWTQPGHALRQGATYAGHPGCCAAALVNIEILEREQLVGRGAALEGALADALTPLADHPLVSGVRAGMGLLGAIELTAPALVPAVHARARERGVMLRALGSSVAVSPPLTIQQPEIDLIGSTVREALDATWESDANRVRSRSGVGSGST